MTYKIVQGNSFKLHILVRKLDMSAEFKRLVDFDLNKADDIKVELIGCFCEPVEVETTISGVSGNVLICEIPSSLQIGNYSVRVSWTYDGYDMVSMERSLIRIVDHNGRSHMPIGMTEGETTGLFDLRYYVVTQNQSICLVSFVLSNITCTYSVDTSDFISNPAGETFSIPNGSSLGIILEPEDGFDLGVAKVFMNGRDGTAEFYDKETGKITIPAVSDYVTVMANGDSEVYYYGASAAGTPCDVDLETLVKESGSIVGKTLTVETTEEKPYIWFVSRVPVDFMQAELTASLNHTKKGELYYYWTDELIPGNDNTYTTKLR